MDALPESQPDPSPSEGVAGAGLETAPVADTAEVEFRRSPIHGWGGFARKPIARGARILEYLGERISKSESLRRCMAENQFIFCLDDQYDLDGAIAGNAARLLNHSCAPNCGAEVSEGRIWIIADRDISAGEEITFNYGYDLMDYLDHPCSCGAPGCVGYIVAEVFFRYLRARREAGVARQGRGVALEEDASSGPDPRRTRS
jgi:hypothetical protein